MVTFLPGGEKGEEKGGEWYRTEISGGGKNKLKRKWERY